MYLCIYIATHLHAVYLDWLQAVLESSVSNGSGLGLEPEPNRGNGFTTWKTWTVGIWAGFHLKTRPLQAQMFHSN